MAPIIIVATYLESRDDWFVKETNSGTMEFVTAPTLHEAIGAWIKKYSENHNFSEIEVMNRVMVVLGEDGRTVATSRKIGL